MDEGSETRQDIPAFVRSALNELITLKSNVSSIDDFNNDIKQININVNYDITDFANKIKEFLNNLKNTVTSINNTFNQSFEAFLKENNAIRNETCTFKPDNTNTTESEGASKHNSSNSNADVIDNSDNEEPLLLVLENKKSKKLVKQKNNETGDSDTSAQSKTNSSQKRRKKRVSSKNVDSDNSDLEHLMNYDKSNLKKSTNSDGLCDTEDVFTKTKSNFDLNDKTEDKSKTNSDSDKENKKNTNEHYNDITKECKKTKITSENKSDSDLNSETEVSKNINKNNEDNDFDNETDSTIKKSEETRSKSKIVVESDSETESSKNKSKKRKKKKQRRKSKEDDDSESDVSLKIRKSLIVDSDKETDSSKKKSNRKKKEDQKANNIEDSDSDETLDIRKSKTDIVVDLKKKDSDHEMDSSIKRPEKNKNENKCKKIDESDSETDSSKNKTKEHKITEKQTRKSNKVENSDSDVSIDIRKSKSDNVIQSEKEDSIYETDLSIKKSKENKSKKVAESDIEIDSTKNKLKEHKITEEQTIKSKSANIADSGKEHSDYETDSSIKKTRENKKKDKPKTVAESDCEADSSKCKSKEKKKNEEEKKKSVNVNYSDSDVSLDIRKTKSGNDVHSEEEASSKNVFESDNGAHSSKYKSKKKMRKEKESRKSVNVNDSDSDVSLGRKSKVSHKKNKDKSRIRCEVSENDVEKNNSKIDPKNKNEKNKIVNESDSELKESEDEGNTGTKKSDTEFPNNELNRTSLFDNDSDSYLEDPRIIIERSKKDLEEKRKSGAKTKQKSKLSKCKGFDELFNELKDSDPPNDSISENQNTIKNVESNKTNEKGTNDDTLSISDQFDTSIPLFDLSSRSSPSVKANTSKRKNNDILNTPNSESTINSKISEKVDTESKINIENENSVKDSAENAVTSEKDEEEKPKIGFLKCIDISKLLDPKVKSIQNFSPKHDDSVIILSSSDSDTKSKANKKKSSEKRNAKTDNKEIPSKKNDNGKERNEKNYKKTKDSVGTNQNKYSKSNKILKDAESSDDEIRLSSFNRNKNNKSEKEIIDCDVSSDDSKRRTRFNRKREKIKSSVVKSFECFRNLRNHRVCKKKTIIVDNSTSSSSSSDNDSESSDSSLCLNARKNNNKKQKIEKKPLEIDPNYDYKTDVKFKLECRVSLPRISVEKLKDYYFQHREDAEINRLTNMKSLKRARNQKDTPSSSDSDEKDVKKRTKMQKNNGDDDQSDHNSHKSDIPNINKDDEKKDRKLSTSDNLLDSDEGRINQKNSSNNEEIDKKKKNGDEKNDKKGTKEKQKNNSDDESEHSDSNSQMSDISIINIDNKKEKSPIPDDLLDSDGGSIKQSDSSDDNDKNKKKKKSDLKKNDKVEKEKEKDKSEENDKDKEKKKENKDKSKWRNDKLLREKLSASDSEDELIRFRNKKNKITEDICSEPEEAAVVPKKSKTKKQLKRIARRLGSDVSSSEDDWKKSDSDKSKKSTDSDSDSEEEKSTKKPVRRRIKRMKESDESSDGENNSKKDKKKKKEDDDYDTRKKIRNVWSKDSLADSSKQAAKEEEQRKKRIADRQKLYNEIYENQLAKKSTVDKVVLDFDEETKEELLSVHPDLVKKLKPHQAEGVRFMWTACYESIERAKNTEGSGCILAHCMGLGKTLQVITLIHTLLSNSETKVKTVLVVCPLSTVLNWVSEFKKWLDDLDGEQVNVFDLVQYKQNYERLYQMQDWIKFGGVMIMGYDMFRNLSNPKGKRMSKKLITGFNKVLLEPGPDLVICDEGHLLKNEKTGISIAMNRLKTLRRIVLTGTPLQNNMKEYFCMVQFVKPSLLGTYKEYLNRFVNPITNGQYTDSTPHDIQIMRRRAHVLHKMLDAVVERRDYNVLAPFLPPKHEYVLFVSLTEVQSQLYREYLDKYSRNTNNAKGTAYLFQDFQELQRICIHPRVLLDKSNKDKLRKEMEEDDSEGSLKDFINDDESEKSTTADESSSESDSGSDKKATVSTRRTRANAGQFDDEPEPELPRSNAWWSKFCPNDELDNINSSSKIVLLFDILHQCELIGDKILVFSQSLYSLNLIEYFLAKVDEATQSGDTASLEKVGGHSGSWALGLDYFRLDGSTSCDNRASWCNTFNNEANTRARLFLISTRAGGLGINLVAANRVIVFDVSWNPSYDIQSIYRVYRFGQTKPCYIYRFVTLGTMENKIYERQVTKQAISKRVIDEQQIDRHYNQTDLAELYAFNPVPDEERPTPLVPKDRLFADLLQTHDKQIFKYHEHNSLLEDKADEGLNEAERQAAWEEFENEKKAPKFNLMQTMVRNGMFETLRILVQEDNNGWTPAQINNILPAVVQRISEQVSRGDYSMYRRVEERHESRVLEQRRMQMIYQQYMQQLRNASGGAPMTPADMNKLAQMFSNYNQSHAAQQQMQPRPQMASSSVPVSFNQGDPPPVSFPIPHPAVSEVVELND